MSWDGCRIKFQEWDLDLVNYVYIHLNTQSCLLNSQYFLHSQMCKILEGSIISTSSFLQMDVVMNIYFCKNILSDHPSPCQSASRPGIGLDPPVDQPKT